MTAAPATLPAVFFSTVVKRQAVVERFPGGVEDFVRLHQPSQANEDLFVVASMSLDDSGVVFERFEAAGLIPGEDFGLVDMHQGVLVACNGVRATGTERTALVWEWSVQLDHDYVAQPEEGAYVWSGTDRAERADAPTVRPLPVTPGASETRKGPRRVVGSLVHWIYDDEDATDEEAPQSVGGPSSPDDALNGTSEPEEPPAHGGELTHVIKAQYTDALIAAHGHMDQPTGEHSIAVDEDTFAKVSAGEELSVMGQGFLVEDEGLVPDEWAFNNRGPGTAAIYLNRGDQEEPEYLEVISISLDGELQPPPKGYCDD